MTAPPRRATARAELDRRLESHLSGAQRMINDAVLEDARSTLAGAREVASPGPRLAGQIERLDGLIARMSVPVPVVLESDQETEVAVYQVGKLGRFGRRELELRPGEYTVVLEGMLRVEHENGTLDVRAGEAVITRLGEWVRYSTPDHGAEFVAVCLPAFSPDTVNRD